MTITVGELIDRGSIIVATGFPSGNHNEEGVGIPHMRPFNVTLDGRVSLLQVKSVPPSRQSDRVLIRGDILFNNTNTAELVGKTAYWDLDSPYVFSNHMTRVRVLDREAVVPRYLALALHREWASGQAQQLSRQHVAQASIIGERFREMSITLPSVAIQARIATVLAMVQRLIDIERGLLGTTEELKRSLLESSFDETNLLDYAKVPLERIAKTSSGGTPARARAEYFGGPIPWVKSGELDDGFIDSTEESLTQQGLETSSAKMLGPGTLLIAMYGATVGKTSILRIGATTNQAICAIIPDPTKVDTSYLRYHLVADRPALLKARYGGAQPNISQQIIRSHEIYLPALDRQREVASRLEAVDRTRLVHSDQLSALDELFRCLLDKLVSGELPVDSLDIDTSEVLGT